MSVDELYQHILARGMMGSLFGDPAETQQTPWADVSAWLSLRDRYANKGQEIDLQRVYEAIHRDSSECGRFGSLIAASLFVKRFGTSDSIREQTAAIGRLNEGTGIFGEGAGWSLKKYALEDLAMLVAEAESLIEDAGYRVADGKLVEVRPGKGRRPQVERLAALELYEFLRPYFAEAWPRQGQAKFPQKLLDDVTSLLEPFFGIDASVVKSAVQYAHGDAQSVPESS